MLASKNDLIAERNQEMYRLKHEEAWTDQQIGDKYNISRERVRQIIGPTSGIRMQVLGDRLRQMGNGTVEALSERSGLCVSKVRKELPGFRFDVEPGSLVAKGADMELEVSRQLSALGIQNRLMPNHAAYDIELADGRRIEVKSAFSNLVSPSISAKTNTENMYRFNINKRNRGEYADFFICVVVPTMDLFIIPASEAPMDFVVINYREQEDRYESKSFRYRGRFDLLTK